jgi:F-type H+-transporting ATPase subunit epsilon
MAKGRLQVSVITPERVVFEGDASQVVAPGWDGQVGVLIGHAPMLVLLGGGPLHIDAAGGQQSFEVQGGFLQVVDDVVTVLTESASG